MRHTLVFCAAIVLFGAPLEAQSIDTGILGTVMDGSGAVVPGSTITITSNATGIVQSVVSGPNGTFEVRYLVPGDYVVQCALSGFRTERTNMALRVGQMARLNFTLQVGAVGEVVDVEAQGLLLETQSGVTGNVVGAEALVNLPLSGRNFTTLGNLTAGVVASGTQFRASGARGMYQQVSFDGVSALNNRGNNLFMYPSVDAVEEFKVQATNYTAEYGGHAGANVQLQLKSGTNSFHGAVFDYTRNDALDARNFFAPAPSPKPAARSPPVRRRDRRPGPPQPDLLHGFVRGHPRDARERGPDERAHRGDAARRLLGRRRGHHPGSAERSSVPRQRDPGRPAGSAGGVDGQPVPAAAQSDRRQQPARRHAHRGHESTSSSPASITSSASGRKSSDTTCIRAGTTPRLRSTRTSRWRACSTTTARRFST